MMARKGNPISVKLDLNRSSDSSWLSSSFERIFLISVLLTTFYSLYLIGGSVAFFGEVLGRIGVSLGGRALSLTLRGVGCSAGRTLPVVFSLRALLTGEYGTHMMVPSGGSGTTWKEDTREIDVLLESFSETGDTGSSVNQPVAPPVPPANPVASPGEEVGPSNPVRDFPYGDDDLIGGDCVRAMEQRFVECLKAKNPSPSLEDFYLARLQAEDRFEVKVSIIKLMAALDPTGDWMGRGARALENSRTATALERLYSLLDEIKEGGIESQAFSNLKSKIFQKCNDDAQNSAS